ncbi:MAG: hypothetical protein JW843_08950 [Candidatus Aminicenantes bacterium]|nr:hypothetical protein [Candidatus Aminicenantes bacterium]
MKTWIRILSLAFLAAAAFASCASNPAPASGVLDTRGWELLGRRQVNFSADHDALTVTAAKGAFSRLMIVVRDRALEMYDLKVVFSNGEIYPPPSRLVFGRDTRSRTIDLPGRKRVIRRIDFAYRSLGSGLDRADVEVWGK